MNKLLEEAVWEPFTCSANIHSGFQILAAYVHTIVPDVVVYHLENEEGKVTQVSYSGVFGKESIRAKNGKIVTDYSVWRKINLYKRPVQSPVLSEFKDDIALLAPREDWGDDIAAICQNC